MWFIPEILTAAKIFFSCAIYTFSPTVEASFEATGPIDGDDQVPWTLTLKGTVHEDGIKCFEENFALNDVGEDYKPQP